jgi:hypothetical protein
LFLGLNWIPEEDNLMSVDMNEEEWYRLNDIRLNGQFVVSIVVESSLVTTGSISIVVYRKKGNNLDLVCI